MTKIKNECTKTIIDNLLWMIIWLLPFISYVVTYWHNGEGIPIFEYVDLHFQFPFVANLFNEIWQKIFDSPLQLSGYVSYIVSVEIVHCFFDAIAFIPRFAHEIVEKGTTWFRGEKW